MRFIFNKILQFYLQRMYRIHYCYGDDSRLHVGENVSLMNTLFNLSSGRVFVGDNTIFGHNCMVITGTHRFKDGMRFSLSKKNSNKFNFVKTGNISFTELSELTQYSEQYLSNLIYKGKLPNNGTVNNPVFNKKQIFAWMEAKEAPITGRDIIIGSGCFIGTGSIINGGVRIGDNTIIASGAVVTKDQPSGVIVAGVPGSVIKKV